MSVAYQRLSALALVAVVFGLAKSESNCSALANCAACIASAGCIWCYDLSYPSHLSRCFAATDSFSASTCLDSLENPTNEVDPVELVLNNMNQVSLESIDLRLKVGNPASFDVSVRAAADFPLDLYLLMDFSGSFRTDLQTVQSIAPQLVTSLSDVTTQFRVGFGAFVDKPAPPYASITQIGDGDDDLLDCSSTAAPNSNCSPTFSFQHIANFTDNENVFTDAINSVQISATADDPEGTLDAMMQAVVCTDVIGWRADARKVLLVMTDDLVHMAGDGALAGINRPNDAVCRTSFDPTTGKTLYTAALEYDYPSIEQVRLALIDYEIVPVVALAPVTADKLTVINAVLNEFDAFTVTLEMDSTNLVDAIRNAYNQIVGQAGLTFIVPSFLSVNVTPECPEGSTTNGSMCFEIDGNTVNFTMTVTLNECVDPVMNDEPYEMLVNVRGFDTFVVNIRGFCSCECSQQDRVEFNSTMCSGNGNLVCGVCECVEPFEGAMCDCDLTQKCPIVDDVECTSESRGICNQCGVCECASNFFGPACECQNFGCDCRGQGDCTSCVNGTQYCDCFSPYMGENCQCTYDVCIDQANPSAGLCYGNGECDPCPPRLGCTCNPTHVGRLCNMMVETTSECSASQTCIECFGTAALQGVNVTEVSGCETATTSCTGYSTIILVENEEDYSIPNTIDSTTECQVSTIQCDYVYYHGVSSSTGQIVYVVEPASCLLIPWWAIPIIVIVGLILVGLTILLVAHLILRWMDYRELKNFQKEVLEADFTKHVNRAYQPPTMTYKNPLHGQS